jgi:hypothetical protein
MSKEEAIAYWMGGGAREIGDWETFVAEGEAGEILGTYTIRPNQAGRAAHRQLRLSEAADIACAPRLNP